MKRVRAAPRRPGKRSAWDQEFRSLITMGESITAGGGASSRERCWATQLARMISEYQRMPIQLINVGLGANLISTRSPNYSVSGRPAGDERLEKHVLSRDGTGAVTDLLVISYGLNDARGGTPLRLFIAELRDLLRRVRERVKPLIVLTGPYYISDYTAGGAAWSHADGRTLARYNLAIGELARATRCLFVDLLRAMDDAPWMVHHDGVHSNDLGHRVVANQIFNVLAANCRGLALETQAIEKGLLPWRDESVLRRL